MMSEPISERARGRVGWGVADQGLSSLTNFLLGVVVARSVSASEFGAFGLAYSIFVLVIGVSRAATAEPLMVRYTAVDRPHLRSATSSAMGATLLIGLIGGVGVLAMGLATSGATRGELIALGLFLPGLLLQDCWRFAFVAAGRSHLSFLNDLAYLLLMAPALWALHASGADSAAVLVAAWGASGTVVGVGAAVGERLSPSLRSAFAWLRTNGDLAYRYVGEFVAVTGALQIIDVPGRCCRWVDGGRRASRRLPPVRTGARPLPGEHAGLHPRKRAYPRPLHGVVQTGDHPAGHRSRGCELRLGTDPRSPARPGGASPARELVARGVRSRHTAHDHVRGVGCENRGHRRIACPGRRATQSQGAPDRGSPHDRGGDGRCRARGRCRGRVVARWDVLARGRHLVVVLQEGARKASVGPTL